MWCATNMQCESPVRFHSPKDIQLWAALLQEHLPTPRWEGLTGGRGWGIEESLLLPRCGCVWPTLAQRLPQHPHAASVSLVSYPPLTGIHLPTPPDSWSIKNKWELGVNSLHIPRRIPGRRARAELRDLLSVPSLYLLCTGRMSVSSLLHLHSDCTKHEPWLMPVLPWVRLARDALKEMDFRVQTCTMLHSTHYPKIPQWTETSATGLKISTDLGCFQYLQLLLHIWACLRHF